MKALIAFAVLLLAACPLQSQNTSTQPSDAERNRQAEQPGAKAYGHTGEVRIVEKRDFVEGCKPSTVCEATDEREGQAGMNNNQTLLLWTNKSVTISGPAE